MYIIIYNLNNRETENSNQITFRNYSLVGVLAENRFVVILIQDADQDFGNSCLSNQTLVTGNDFNIKLGTGSHVFPINNYLGRDKSRLFVNFKMVIFNGKFVGDFRISA